MKTSVLILTSLLTAAPALAAGKPNIVIILADDLGYADLGCQGCQDIPTPHIDSIAAGGVRFTDGYATHPVCSPSRAGLMSGMYQHRFGFEHNSGPSRYASPEFGLPRTIPTLAERLKAAGYATAMVGKWHIGFTEGLRPHERGFDYHFGFLSGAHPYLPELYAGYHEPLYSQRRDRDRREGVPDRRFRARIGRFHRAQQEPAVLPVPRVQRRPLAAGSHIRVRKAFSAHQRPQTQDLCRHDRGDGRRRRPRAGQGP